MITIHKTLYVLQYGRAGEPGPGSTINKKEADQFVDLDDESGGYPFAVPFEKAHDFGSETAANQYLGHFKGLYMRRISAKYTYVQEERLGPCPHCHGTGTTSSIVDHDADYNSVWASETCSRCGGSGKTEL